MSVNFKYVNCQLLGENGQIYACTGNVPVLIRDRMGRWVAGSRHELPKSQTFEVGSLSAPTVSAERQISLLAKTGSVAMRSIVGAIGASIPMLAKVAYSYYSGSKISDTKIWCALGAYSAGSGALSAVTSNSKTQAFFTGMSLGTVAQVATSFGRIQDGKSWDNMVLLAEKVKNSLYTTPLNWIYAKWAGE